MTENLDTSAIDFTSLNFVNVFEKVLSAILIVDYEKRIIFANTKACELLNIKREKIVEQSINSILNGIEECCNFPKSSKENLSDKIQVCKNWFTLFSGEKKYLDLKIFPILEGLLIFFTDLTETLKFEKKFKSTERRLSKIVQLLPDIIFETNSRLEITYVNPSGFKKLGYSITDVEEGFTVWRVLDQSEWERAKRDIEKLEKGELFGPINYKLKKKDGNIFYARIHTCPSFEKGNFRGICGVITDITEARRIQHELEEAKEQFETITEQSLLGIAILQDGYVRYCNEKVSEIFGYSRDEILNWPYEGYSRIIHPDDREWVMEQGQKKQEGKEDVLINYQFKGLTKEGNQIWLDLYSKTISWRGRSADLVMLLDITDRKRVEELKEELIKKIKMQREQFKTSSNEKEELLNIIAHQLRTPLISIKGFAELLAQDSSNLTVQQMQYLTVLERNVQRMHRQLDQILNLRKLESKKAKLLRQTIDVRKLIQNVLEELQYSLQQKKHQVFLKIPPKLTIQADPEYLFTVITNLLDNAIKFTPDRGIITIEVKKEGLKALFSIKDTGVGISKEDIPKLFKKFVDIPKDKENILGDIEGIGLGLAISKRIVELHGGKIWAKSAGINKGTTFHFEIPILY
ncbi:MAG: PAS domain S-box protein [Candidatus Helarchaeota archaeon]